jgi:ABC-type bacteriocin/lantibiotic exporter with double-glycine peptidase domain
MFNLNHTTNISPACTPILLSTGYTRLLVVMLKDAKNKAEHAQSAQIACESTAAIRTVAALTREEECLAEYSASLEQPLKRAVRASALSTLVFSASQASMFFVIALVFWYGSTLFAKLEITVFQLFVGLMVSLLVNVCIFLCIYRAILVEHDIGSIAGWRDVPIRTGHVGCERRCIRYCDTA